MHDSILDTAPPEFSLQAASRIATTHFGLEGQARPLVSERDQNFHLQTDTGEQFVLKIANPSEHRQVLDFQVRALRHAASIDPSLPLPRVHPGLEGQDIATVKGAGQTCYLARMVSYVEGLPLGDSAGATSALHSQQGALLARLGRALRGYFHPAARHELLWDMKHALRLRDLLPGLPRAQRQRVADVLNAFESSALPMMPGLRAQVIHNDMNPDNLLVDPANPDRIAGIIDFGDLVHSPLIIDVAVAAAYQLADTAEPLQPLAALVRAYHEVTPLEEAELAILFELIATRVATSVAISNWRAKRYPENADYILTSNPRAVRMLDRLAEVSRAEAGEFFRHACGIESRAPLPADTPDLVEAESEDQLGTRRDRALGPAYRLFYERPVHVVRGNGVWLYDRQGLPYLDVYNNVAHVGHCHRHVVNAITQQTARLNTHTRYLHRAVVDYAERLRALFPSDDPVCLFCCTGSEANELAYRIAQAHTGGTGVVVTPHSYHGNTSTVAQFSTSDTPSRRRGDFVQTVSAPDSYRGAYEHAKTDLAEHYAAEILAATGRMQDKQIKPAMLIVDTIFSCDGVITPPEGYLAGAAAHIREAGGLFVADEVQAGFGRTGERFWGFERHGVVPDIVTLGKPIGNGYPLAAVICPRRIVESFARQIDYFNTFGGNPVASAAGMAVLDVLEAEGLQRNALDVGAYTQARLTDLQNQFELIGDIRGAGLFIGVELVRDRQLLTPARQEASKIVNAMREQGVLIGATGPDGNVLKIRPPLVFSRENADRLVDTLQSVISVMKAGSE